MTASPAASFLRDRFTLLAYAMLGYFAYLQAAPGVAMPLLRDDLRLSYTVGGMHISALALGMVLAGLLNDRAIARWGRPAIFWAGGAGMGLGALLLAAGRHPAITIAGMGLMGLLGTALLAAIQSGLADQHGARRAIAITEANVVASASTILPPLLIGGFERAGIGWQWAFVLPALLWGAAYLRERGDRIPTAPPGAEGDTRSTGPLPHTFWRYWLAVVFCVAVEWSVVAWSADFLVKAGGFRKADAALLMALYFGAMLIGRITGSALARRADLPRLLFAALSIGVAGYAVLWLVPVTPLRVAGLFVAGLGIANLYPFLLATSLGTAPQQSDAASARLTLGIGLAILLAPQVLGAAADATSIQTAYGLVLALFALTWGAVIAARRLESA